MLLSSAATPYVPLLAWTDDSSISLCCHSHKTTTLDVYFHAENSLSKHLR